MDAVHLAITRRVKPGREAEFAAALREFARDSLHEPGTTGIHLIEPVPETDEPEFGILRSFDSEWACRDFYRSQRYQRWEHSVAHLVDGPPIRRQLNGFEAFFRTSRPAPPRWKMALITWLGVYPVALFWMSVLPAQLFTLPRAVYSILTTGLMVASLAWVVMPWLTRIFRPWLDFVPHRVRRTTQSALQAESLAA
ncbi:MAG: antibiotic biosynthesis monooxygenase [Pirellulales bacterium]|nr:antibiotic biosynthesis monooxygenase [Pirellulales bacterium]